MMIHCWFDSDDDDGDDDNDDDDDDAVVASRHPCVLVRPNTMSKNPHHARWFADYRKYRIECSAAIYPVIVRTTHLDLRPAFTVRCLIKRHERWRVVRVEKEGCDIVRMANQCQVG